MRTFLRTPFEQLSPSPGDVATLAAKAISLPTRLLRAPVAALSRSRKQARAQADFAQLNDRVLADIGLRRAPADHWQPLNGPCF